MSDDAENDNLSPKKNTCVNVIKHLKHIVDYGNIETSVIMTKIK